MIGLVYSFLLTSIPATLPALYDESVDQLVERGRALLEAEKPSEALTVFQDAAKKDGDRLHTRVWVWRAQLALGALDDTLAAVDEARAKGEKGSELDYLYGFGFYLMAKRAVTQGQGNAFTGQQFGDAVSHLGKALAADGDRYRDAYVALADAAYFVPDLVAARKAADQAIVVQSHSVDAWIVHATICMAQFIATKDDASKAAEADAHWKAACDSWTRALADLGAKNDASSRAKRVQAGIDLGGAYVWKKDNVNAAKAYSAAIATDPSLVDFAKLHELVGGENFLAILKSAKPHFHSSTETAAGEGALSWWLGWAYFDRKQYADAADSFHDAIGRKFGVVNAQFYLFKSYYSVQDYNDAIGALREYCEGDPEGSAQTLAADKDANLAMIEYLIGYELDPANHKSGPLNDVAAMLAEYCTRIAPTDARHWNNLGLFLRDHGDDLRKREPKTDAAKLTELWQRSYAAYARALELSPDDPNYLNDTAVMLDYYLDRELERALGMYDRAYASAEKMLARKDLDPQKRQDVETAKRDSKNNSERLKKRMQQKDGGKSTDAQR